MSRLFTALFLILAAPILSGCLIVKTVDVAADVAGATIGAAGDVVEGAVDVVTPDGDDDEDDDGEERERQDEER